MFGQRVFFSTYVRTYVRTYVCLKSRLHFSCKIFAWRNFCLFGLFAHLFVCPFVSVFRSVCAFAFLFVCVRRNEFLENVWKNIRTYVRMFGQCVFVKYVSWKSRVHFSREIFAERIVCLFLVRPRQWHPRRRTSVPHVHAIKWLASCISSTLRVEARLAASGSSAAIFASCPGAM